MASLSELVQYAQAQQPQNTLADVATHFLEGANSGYEAGKAQARKDQDNPLIEDPITHTKQRLDVVSKLLDVHAKMAAAEEANTITEALKTGMGTTDLQNRSGTLAQMAQNELEKTSGVAGNDRSEKAQIGNIIANPKSNGRRPGKMTVSLKDGRPSISMDFADPKKTTVDQISAMKNYVETNGDADSTAALALAFPDGPPEWAAKFMAQHTEIKMKKDQIADEKRKTLNQQRLLKLSEVLDPSKQKTGAFGVSKGVFDRAERLQTLAEAYPNGNLDSRGIEELAIGLNSMLSGSNTGAQEQVKALVPRSARGNYQKFKEWLVNDPQGTNQQAFVQRMMGSVAREKETAAAQIKRTQLSRLAPFAGLEKDDPENFGATLQSYGIELGEYEAFKKGGRKPASAVVKGGEGADPAVPKLDSGEVLRKSGDRMAVFNAATKQFVRWAQ